MITYVYASYIYIFFRCLYIYMYMIILYMSIGMIAHIDSLMNVSIFVGFTMGTDPLVAGDFPLNFIR